MNERCFKGTPDTVTVEMREKYAQTKLYDFETSVDMLFQGEIGAVMAKFFGAESRSRQTPGDVYLPVKLHITRSYRATTSVIFQSKVRKFKFAVATTAERLDAPGAPDYDDDIMCKKERDRALINFGDELLSFILTPNAVDVLQTATNVRILRFMTFGGGECFFEDEDIMISFYASDYTAVMRGLVEKSSEFINLLKNDRTAELAVTAKWNEFLCRSTLMVQQTVNKI